MEPGSAARASLNGRGRAVPRSLVQLTAAAAFKFCSSRRRKQEAPELLARASLAHPRPSHPLASLPQKSREWRFSSIRRKAGASRGPGRAMLGSVLLLSLARSGGGFSARLAACPAISLGMWDKAPWIHQEDLGRLQVAQLSIPNPAFGFSALLSR